MNITDIFRIAEIKSAAAAEAQKIADTIKALNEVCKNGGYESLEVLLATVAEFNSENSAVSTAKKVKSGKKAVNVTKAPKKTGNRSAITQATVEEMAKDCDDGLLTAAKIAEKHGVSVASYNVYKKKKFVWNPKPKGRRKKVPKDSADVVQPT